MYSGADICTEVEKRSESRFMIKLIFEQKKKRWLNIEDNTFNEVFYAIDFWSSDTEIMRFFFLLK